MHTFTRFGLLLNSALLLAIVGMAPVVHADTLETLIMPGKVIQGHAKYEDDCDQCHTVFRKDDQSGRCLACHKEINADVKAKKGFHGRLKSGPNAGCKTCHTDHKGRNADIIKFDPQTFNHDKTDYALRDRHTTVACASCHKPKKKYREATSSCVSCHKKQSPHGEGMGKKLGEKCESCHVEKGWKVIDYDHSKTEYPLTGKHKTTLCVACHANERYAKTPKDCFSCHRLNDVHAGTNGKDCKKCHTTRDWKKMSFDHDKDTDFPLTGKHADISCRSCHKEDAFKVKLKLTCISCHKADDVHKGQNGVKCESCHNTRDWKKSKFNHDKTKFKLRGKHKDAACGSCHKGDPYKVKVSVACYDCHQYDDVHKGQQGKLCQNCHNDRGWREKVRFDHDVTHFPLIGLHAVTPCEECHISGSYKDTDKECNSCHAKKDVHKQKLGVNCQLCHNPNGWKIWRFDHDKQSDFKIDGGHKKLHCDDCHRTAVKEVPHSVRDCLACHRTDDVHNGQFGPRCAQCHTTESFKDIHFNR